MQFMQSPWAGPAQYHLGDLMAQRPMPETDYGMRMQYHPHGYGMPQMGYGMPQQQVAQQPMIPQHLARLVRPMGY